MSEHWKIRLVWLAVLASPLGCSSVPQPPVPEVPDLAGAIQQAANADTAVVAFNQPAPCCKRQTLPQFLGITGACNAILGCVDNIRNRLGLIYPELEAVPPVLAITDPANLAEGSPPAVKAAASIKKQEDQAAQKIKALRYLATIGCGGCYPDVEEALIAAMEDCTEAVRYEAVLAVRETTGVNCCFCSQGSCCSEKIQEKLRTLAFEGGACCPAEPSARVRRQARIALAKCGPPVEIVQFDEPEPAEEPEEEPEEVEGPDAEEVEGEEAEGEAEEDGVDVDVDVDVDAEDGSAVRVLPSFPASGIRPPVLNAAQPRPLPRVYTR